MSRRGRPDGPVPRRGRRARRQAQEARKVAGEAGHQEVVRREAARAGRTRHGDFMRAVTLPDDPELLTRHEVLAAPPDVLVTNYSMLEYMLMRPLERPIFDAHPTTGWLTIPTSGSCSSSTRPTSTAVRLAPRWPAAPPAPVAARHRPGPPAGHQHQRELQRRGRTPGSSPRNCRVRTSRDFRTVEGDLKLREPAAARLSCRRRGTWRPFRSTTSTTRRRRRRTRCDAVADFLAYRGVTTRRTGRRAALRGACRLPADEPLVNVTMTEAQPVAELGRAIFPGVDESNSPTRPSPHWSPSAAPPPEAGRGRLLPCRVHAFFRGLPALGCLDPDCSELDGETPEGQARSASCTPSRGPPATAARGCSSSTPAATAVPRTPGPTPTTLVEPTFLWHEPGRRVPGRGRNDPGVVAARPAARGADRVDASQRDLDLVTGRLNPRARRAGSPGLHPARPRRRRR